MRAISVVVGMALVGLLVLVSPASALEVAFVPPDHDIYDLDHWYYYSWGIDYTIPETETITAARLEIYQISNWNNQENYLYAHLLEDCPAGLSRGHDVNDAFADYFEDDYSGEEMWLFTESFTTTPVNYVYNFSADELAYLTESLLDGNFGIGFDPDCHYYNRCIRLVINTGPIPEPATIALLGTGLAVFGWARRKRRS